MTPTPQPGPRVGVSIGAFIAGFVVAFVLNFAIALNSFSFNGTNSRQIQEVSSLGRTMSLWGAVSDATFGQRTGARVLRRPLRVLRSGGL